MNMSHSSNEPLSSKQFNPLAGCQFPLAVLAVDALLATTKTGRRTLFCKLANDVVHKVLLPNGRVNQNYSNRSETIACESDDCLAAGF
jgi:hypothetical protein